MVCIHIENQNQVDLYPFVLLEMKLVDLPLEYLTWIQIDQLVIYLKRDQRSLIQGLFAVFSSKMVILYVAFTII